MSSAGDPQKATQDAGAAPSLPAALAPEEYPGLFNSIDEGFCIIEMIFDADGAAVDYRFLETNGAFESQTGLHDVSGKRVRELEPFHEDHWFAIYGAVATTGQPRRFTEVAKYLGDRWFDCYAFPTGNPSDQRVAVLFRDITERRRDEEAAREAADRDRFRAVLAEALRPLTDPLEVQSEACRVLGAFLGASRVFYFEVELDGDHIILHWDYTAAGVASIAGRYRISDFGSYIRDGFHAGHTLAVADGPSDERLTESERSAYVALNFRAYVGVPLVKNGRLVAALGVHQTEPRSWTSDEVALVEEVAERTWAAVEQAKAEAALRASEERVRLALDSAAMGSFVWYPDEDRAESDGRMLALFGLREDGTLNLREALATLIHPADGPPYAEAVARAVDPEGRGELHEQIRVIHPGGAQRWLAISGQTYFEGEPRRAVRMAGTGIDITDRKRTEEAIRQAAERDRFRAALGDALRPLADPIEIQRVASRLLGEHLNVNRVSYGEIVGSDLIMLASFAHGVAPLERFPYAAFGEQLFDRAKTTVVVDDVALDARLGDAERAAYRAAEVAALVRVLLVKENRLVASLGVHSAAPRSWTADEVALAEETAERTWAALERARAEQALRESEEQYRALFNSMDQGFCVVQVLLDDAGDPVDYRFLEANPVFEQQTGLRDALGRTARELVPDLEEGWFETYGRVALSGEPTRFELPSEAMGRWFDVYAFRVGEPESRQVAILFSDVTEQRRIDSELRASEERFRSMANASPTIIWTADPAGAITFHNQRWLDYTGITAEQNMDDWPTLVLHPDDVERCVAAWTYSLETGTNYEIEVRNRRFDGEYRWFLTRATPERDSAGRIIQWLGSSTDIHDRKQIEERLRDREVAERRARQRAELIAAVVGELEVVDGVRRRAERLTELLVPRVADYASVELPGDGGSVARGEGPATVTLPLVIGARSSGLLSLGLSNPARRPYSAEDRAFLREIAERAGLLLGNAHLQEEEHQIALRLQRALLPNRVLQSPDVAIAARYQAGSDGLEVGGDWYDSFLLPDGRIGLVVGDVVGHGLDAAAAMGRLRTALVAIAGRIDSPGQLLTALDEFASGPDGAEFATACYAVLDPATRELRYASAAHPPLLVLTPSGRGRWLEDGRSLPLGGAHVSDRLEASTVLDPDALLLLYSDGLIERRRESVSVGLARLERAAKAHRSAPVEELCDRLIVELGVDADRDDDAVVMCVRLVPAGARFHRTFPARPEELAPLRAAVRQWVASRRLSDKAGSALLLALGEACANAIEHAYRDRPTGLVEVEIRADGPDLLVCVRDFGSWRPRPPEEDAARGFGSSIIGKLTRSFTRDAGADGTTVSFRLRTEGGGA